MTAAGGVIAKDVPAGALAIARTEQANKDGWVERFRKMKRRVKAKPAAE